MSFTLRRRHSNSRRPEPYSSVHTSRGDAHVYGQMRQELVDFRLPHLHRVTLPVEEDEPPDPCHVGLLSTRAVMFGTEGLMDSVAELGVRGCSLRGLRFVRWLPIVQDARGTKRRIHLARLSDKKGQQV